MTYDPGHFPAGVSIFQQWYLQTCLHGESGRRLAPPRTAKAPKQTKNDYTTTNSSVNRSALRTEPIQPDRTLLTPLQNRTTNQTAEHPPTQQPCTLLQGPCTSRVLHRHHSQELMMPAAPSSGGGRHRGGQGVDASIWGKRGLYPVASLGEEGVGMGMDWGQGGVGRWVRAGVRREDGWGGRGRG